MVFHKPAKRSFAGIFSLIPELLKGNPRMINNFQFSMNGWEVYPELEKF